MEILAVIKILLTVCVLILSLVSLVKYSGRRLANKGTLRKLRDGSRPIRSLSVEERPLIQPCLFHPRSPKRALKLVDDAVYVLEGEFVRHGLEVQHSEIMHDTLGGVDVILPYDAHDHLGVVNRAEVVLVEGFAVVIRLNDTFDLAGGKARAEQKKQAEREWRLGKAGQPSEAVATGDVSDAQAGPNASDEAKLAEAREDEPVRMLGQREETLAEATNRTRPDSGLVAVLVLAGAFASLVAAGATDDVWSWLLPSLLLFPLGIWLAWRPKRIGRRQRVNRVEGMVAPGLWRSPKDPTNAETRLFVGDKFPIVVPEHWQAEFPVDRKVTLDMRVDDYSVVAFGDKHSIDAEERRFPRVHWGRHALLGLAAAVMSIVALGQADDLGLDLKHLVAGLRGGSPQKLEQVSQVLAHLPAEGDLVEVNAKLRCQIGESYGTHPPRVDCRHLRLGGDELRIDEVPTDPLLAKLQDGSLLKTHRNPMLDMLAQMKLGLRDDVPSYALGARPSVVVVDDLTELVLAVEKVCAGSSGGSSPCASVKRDIAENLAVDGERGSLSWQALVARAKKGALQGDDDSTVVTSVALRSIEGGLRTLAQPLLAEQHRAALDRALESQRGGVLIALIDEGEQEAELPSDWVVQWQAIRGLTHPASLSTVNTVGLVVKSEKSSAGDPVLTVDTRRRPDNYGPAFARLLAVVVALALLGLHGALAVSNWLRVDLRKQAIRRHYEVQDGTNGSSATA